MLASQHSFDYLYEGVIQERIEEVCEDILKKGTSSNYNEIYDAIYELVESDLIEEREDLIRGCYAE